MLTFWTPGGAKRRMASCGLISMSEIFRAAFAVEQKARHVAQGLGFIDLDGREQVIGSVPIQPSQGSFQNGVVFGPSVVALEIRLDQIPHRAASLLDVKASNSARMVSIKGSTAMTGEPLSLRPSRT